MQAQAQSFDLVLSGQRGGLGRRQPELVPVVADDPGEGVGLRGEHQGVGRRDLPAQLSLPGLERPTLRVVLAAQWGRVLEGLRRLRRRRELRIALVGAEEPDVVLPDRPAQGEEVVVDVLVELGAREGLSADLAVALVLRIPVVVGDQGPGRSVERVRARLGDDVDDRSLRAAVLRRDRGVGDHDFLDGVEVVVGAEGARRRIRRVDAVEQVDVRRVDRPVGVRVAVRVGVVHSGSELDEILIAARNGERLAELRVGRRQIRDVGLVDQRDIARNDDGLGRLRELQGNGHRRDLLGGHDVAFRLEGVETLEGRLDRVPAGRQNREVEASRRI